MPAARAGSDGPRLKPGAANASSLSCGVVAIDRDKSVRKIFEPKRTPEMWVLDKEGRIAFYGAPENTLLPGSKGHRYLLREAIDALRAGKPPEVRRYDPIGCLIED